MNRSLVTTAVALGLFGLVVLSASADATAPGAERRADWTLTVTLPASNTGTGKVTGTGIDCPGDCTESYPQGTPVSIFPTPAANSTFGGWTGACEGSGTECRLSGAASAQVGAVFRSTAPPDTEAPETTIDGPKKVKTTKKKAAVEFAFESSESDSTFECSLDDGPFAACTSPDKFKAKLGKHSFAVQATDAAGNTDASAAKQTFKVVEKKN